MRLGSFLRHTDPYVALFSILVSTSFGFGILVLDHVFTPQPQIQSTYGYATIVALSIAGAFPLYVCIKFLFGKIDNYIKANEPNAGQSYTQLRDITRRKGLPYAGIILTGWLPYLLIRFPGNIDSDTYWQLEQIYGLVQPNDQHPYFDTLIFGAFWKLGDALHSHFWSLLIFVIIQMTVTALVLSLSLCYLQFINMPRWLRRACLLFSACYPTVALFAQTMAKDMLFSWIWVLLVISLMEIIRSRGGILKHRGFLVSLMFVVLLTMLTKKTGIYLTFGAFAVTFLCAKRHRLRCIASFIIPAALFLGIWTSILLPMWNVAPGPEREMLAVPSQQTAMYIRMHKDRMTSKDWSTLSRVFEDPQSLGEIYTPARGDNTKGRWKESSTTEDKKAFLTWWLDSLRDDPKSFILAFAANSLPVYYPDISTEGDESTLFYGDKVTSQDTTDENLISTLIAYSGGKATRSDILELTNGASRDPAISSVSDTFSFWFLRISHAFPILFSKVLFTTWIPLFSLCYCLRKKRWLGVACLAPAALTLLTLMIGPIAIPRYLVAVLYTTPLTLGSLFIQFDASSKRRGISTDDGSSANTELHKPLPLLGQQSLVNSNGAR
jgi:hypothetical protein